MLNSVSCWDLPAMNISTCQPAQLKPHHDIPGRKRFCPPASSLPISIAGSPQTEIKDEMCRLVENPVDH